MLQANGQGPAPLGNYGNKVARPGQKGWRGEALELRQVLWTVSSIPDIRKCGRVRRASLLEVRETGHGYRLGGLCRCHSVWACPICSTEIRTARGVEIGLAVELHLAGGGGTVFGSATVPHGRGDRLKDSYSVVAEAWTSVLRDKSVRRFREAHGYWGFIRTAEVTYGQNGWHPHVHWLDFWGEVLGDGDRVEYEAMVYRAWAAAVVRLGMGEPSRRRGVVLLPVHGGDIGEYVTKLSPTAAGHELTALSTKTARYSGLTPFDLLRRLRDEGGQPWTGLWWEYEKATRGRRMLGASRRLLDRLGICADDPDPEACGAPVVGFVTAEQWDALRFGPGVRGAQAFIEAAAVNGHVGIQAAVSFLLGQVVAPVVVDLEAVQLRFGPGDDGGMF